MSRQFSADEMKALEKIYTPPVKIEDRILPHYRNSFFKEGRHYNISEDVCKSK